MEVAEKSGEVIALNKTTIEKVERDAFGFNLPNLRRIFGGDGNSSKKPKKLEKENDLTAPVKRAESIISPPSSEKPSTINAKPKSKTIKEVKLTIRKTSKFGRNQTRFFFENGQVWEQIERIEIRVPKVRDGRKNTAIIKKAALGSFKLRINGKGAAIRVRRVR